MAKGKSPMSVISLDPNAGAALSEAMDPPKPEKPKKPRVRPEIPFVRGTVLVPRTTYKRLKDIANEEFTTFQGIVQEALEQWLTSRGEPSFFPKGWEGWNPPKKESAQ